MQLGQLLLVLLLLVGSVKLFISHVLLKIHQFCGDGNTVEKQNSIQYRDVLLLIFSFRQLDSFSVCTTDFMIHLLHLVVLLLLFQLSKIYGSSMVLDYSNSKIPPKEHSAVSYNSIIILFRQKVYWCMTWLSMSKDMLLTRMYSILLILVPVRSILILPL